MTNSSTAHRLTGVSALAICWAIGASASAQTAPAAPPSSDTVEEVVVTGIRKSIAAALEQKRAAESIVDVVSAEDIGKLPDQNIAESMSRIPGVQISRKDGEGSNFTIRGIDLNRVEINGRSFTGPTQNATPALQALNPEILSAIEVIKSPTADLTEGALGGTVNLRTRRPLDERKSLVASGRIQGVYGNKVDQLGYRGSAMISKKFADGTFGVSGALAYGAIQARGEGFNSGGWAETSANSGIYRPNRIVVQIEDRSDKRVTANGALQWKPDGDTEVNFETTYSKFDVNRSLNYYQTLLAANASLSAPATPSNLQILPDGTIAKGTYSGVVLRPLAYEAPTRLETFSTGLSARKRFGRLEVTGDVSYSTGKGSDGPPGSPFTFVMVNSPGNTVNIDYDLTANRVVPNFTQTSNFNLFDPQKYQLFSLFDGDSRADNKGRDGKIDLKYDLDWGVVRRIKGGVRAEKTELIATDPQSTPAVNAAILAAADKNGDGVIRPNELPSLSYRNQYSGDFLPEVDGNFPRSFLTGVVNAEQGRKDIGVGEPARQPLSEKYVDQTSKAAYAMADLAGELGSISYKGNVGVRYVSTERTSKGFAVGATAGTFVDTASTSKFNNWLPSANISFNLREDLILRLAGAKVIARPPLSSVGAGITVNLVNLTGTAGNPDLKPFAATQFDATLEWYFAEASLLSVAVFDKKVNSFTVQTVTSEIVPGSERFGPLLVSRPENGADGTIRGFELGYQHALKFLPEPFDGLGFQINYTYSDSTTPIIDTLDPTKTLPLTNLSKNSYNLVGYYEKGPISGRVAYSYRDKYLATVQAKALGGSIYNDYFGQLDASANYQINDRFRFTLEATGLNAPVQRKYTGTTNRPNETFINDTRVTFGIAGTF